MTLRVTELRSPARLRATTVIFAFTVRPLRKARLTARLALLESRSQWEALCADAREARFLVFRCADSLDADDGRYYESVRLSEARHPQSLLAYDMNDAPLTVPHGAPLRARLERKLGYKMAKYIVGLELVDSLEGIAGGQGGYWEDRGYQWHAGI